MRFLSALIIFLIGTFILITTATYVRSDTQKLGPILHAQNRHRVDLGYISHWFRGQKSGLSCKTWFRCTAGGARVRGIYLEVGEDRFPLGETRDGLHFIDNRGMSPVGVEFQSCEGGDHGLSFNIFPQVKADTVGLNVVSDNTGKVDTYYYSLPSDFEFGEENMRAIVVFEAQTGGTWQVYEQASAMQSCL